MCKSSLYRARTFGMLSLLGLTFGLTARSAEFTWVGAADGNWNNALNWNTGVPPGAVDTALIFGAAGPATTTNNIPGGLTLNALTIGAASAARNFEGNALTFAGTAPTLLMQGTTGDAFFTQNMVLGSTLAVTGGPTFVGQLLLAGDISGAGGVDFVGGGSSIYGANTFTGATKVGAGALVGVAGGGLAGSSGVTVEAGGALQLLRQSATLGTNVNRTLTLSGTVYTTSPQISILGSPANGIFWSGAVTLGGDATMLASGGTAGLFGKVVLGVSGSINLSGHELTLRTNGVNNEVRVTGAISGDGNVRVLDTVDAGLVTLASLTGNGRLDVDMLDSLGSITVTGNITGNREIEVTGGTLTLGGSGNTFTGSIVADGIESLISVTTSSRLGNAANAVTLRNGAALQLTTSGTVARAIGLVNGGALLGTFGGSSSYTGNITGTGGLIVGGGSFTFSGNNTYTGGLRVVGSSVNYTLDTQLGAAGEKIVLEGGQLNVPAAANSFDRPVELLGSSTGGPIGFIVLGNNQPFTFASDVSGPGRLELNGRNGQAITVSGDITGAGERRFTGRSTFTLTGDNTFTGRLTVLGSSSTPTTIIAASAANLGGAASPMTLGSSATTPVILRATGNLDFAATRTTSFSNLTVDTNGHNVTFNQAMTGAGIVKNGEGVLTFGGLTDSGGVSHSVRINAGTLRLGVGNALGSSASVNLAAASAVLDLAGHDLSASVNADNLGSQILLGAGTLTLRGGTIYADISGSGGLVLTGGSSSFSPEVELNGTNSFTGGVRVEQFATLRVGESNPLATPGNSLVLDNGRLRVTGAAPQSLVIGTSTALTIGPGGATFDVAGGFVGKSIVIERQLTGVAPLRFIGGSEPGAETQYEVRLTHANNTFTGPIALGNGSDSRDAVLGIVADGSLGAAANTLTLGDRFDTGEGVNTNTGGLRAFASLTLPVTRVIRLSGDDGSGGGVIDTNGFGVVIEGNITELADQSAPLLKTGTGTLVLTGTNTYTGATTINAGTLKVSGSTATSAFRINSGGTLLGTGTVGALTVASGGTLSPGNSPGTLTAGNTTFAGGGAYVWEINNATGVLGSNFDLLSISGTLTVTATGGSPFSINLTSLLADNSPGDVMNFNSAQNYSYTLATASSGIAGFSASAFTLDTSSFTNALSGGTWSLVQSGNNLNLNFTASAIPEPSTYAAIFGAATLAIAAYRRRGTKGSRIDS